MPTKYLFGNDQFAILENTLRTRGGWAHKMGGPIVSHYYVARNENSDLAVTLCWQAPAHMSKLQLEEPTRKCLVCDLFLSSREEVKRHHINKIEAMQVATETQT